MTPNLLIPLSRSLDQLTFENLAEETLENLLEFLEELGDEEDSLTDFDVTYSVRKCILIYPYWGIYEITVFPYKY